MKLILNKKKNNYQRVINHIKKNYLRVYVYILLIFEIPSIALSSIISLTTEYPT